MPHRQYHNAGAASRRITQHFAKITIQCDERSAFLLAHVKQYLVYRPAQPLTVARSDIVAGGADQIGGVPAEILVELEFHATFSVGIGMICSRAASAPYAIAANTSSRVNPGYSASNSASVMPLARKSRMSETQIRVPFIQGLPPQILGSIVIRSKRGFTALPRTICRRFSYRVARQSSTTLPVVRQPWLRYRVGVAAHAAGQSS